MNTVWVDLKKSDFSIYLASFKESDGEHAILIRGTGHLSGQAMQSLSKAGFFRMAGDGEVWARPGGVFKMRELREAFPSMIAFETPIQNTRVMIAGESPFVAQQAASKASRQPDNQFQLSYLPGSALGTPIAMIPVNLAEPTYKALKVVMDAYGPIDTFVANELDMTLHELERALSPEQIDAVAMAISCIRKGRDFLVADQTGLGKGRVLAALSLWASRVGKKVIFISEKANLFSDFWRDIRDIGADDQFGVPFLLNSGSKIIDVASSTGDKLFESGKDDHIKKVMRSGSLPDDSKLMLCTFSQFNRASSAKSKFLQEVANDALVIGDEIHNATGASNTADALEAALANSFGVVRSSATFVRRASSLLSFPKVLPPSLRMEDTPAMLEAGGEPLAEALAQYLAEDGILLRREQDLSGIELEVVIDHERLDRNRALSDALAPILSKMAKLHRLVNDEIEARNDENEQKGGKAAKEKWYSANFGSRLSPLIRQFVMALSVDHCIDRCVHSLQNNQKPVVVIEHTMESMMRELSGDGDASAHEEDPTSDVAGAPPPDFRAALNLMLDRIMHMSVKQGKDDPEKVPVEDPFCVAEADSIKKLIDAFPDLSLSPLDDIRERIEEIGREFVRSGKSDRSWSVGEISARKMRVIDGLYEVVKPVDRNTTIVAFNNGDLDALVLTKAASTGLSLHASEKAKDQRQRKMIELQIPSNVVDRIQFWGRVNRRGQVCTPSFETMCTGLPLQMRSLAMENRKLSSVSATVSANSANANAMDVPDIIDSLGNSVAQRMLEDQPKLAERMCIAMRVDPEQAEQELYHINKILQRLCLLPAAEQDTIFETLVSEYGAALEELKAKGKNPRGVRELEGRWKEVSRKTYEDGNDDDGAVFGRSVDLVTMEGVFERDPYSSQKVANLIRDSRERLYKETGEISAPYFHEHIKEIKKSRRAILTASLAGRFISVDSALKSKEPNAVKNADQRLSGLTEILLHLQPGVTISTPGEDEGERKTAVVVSIVPPPKDEFHLPGRWAIKYAAPGDSNLREISIATVLRGREYVLHQTRPSVVPEPNLAAFDQAPSGEVVERRVFLDGNLVKAVSIAAEAQAGSMVIYYDEAGNRQRSVLVSRKGASALNNRTRKVRDVEEAVDHLKEGLSVFTRPYDKASGLVVLKEGASYFASVPRGKEGKQYETEAIMSIVGVFRPGTDCRRARVSPDKIEKLLQAVLDEGYNLHFDPPGVRPKSTKTRSFGYSPQKRSFPFGR